MDVKFTSHADEAISEAEMAIRRALERIGQRGEKIAKVYCPVDTGRLRNSISHSSDDSRAVIGTNVEYAPYVELGTSKRTPHAFLRPAVALHVDEYRRIVEAELKGS